MTPEQFARMLADDDAPAAPTISHEGQIARCRELAARYAAPCPFAVGDLVTPRGDSNVTCKGQPHVVVELGQLPPAMHDEPGTTAFGARFDMRVAHVQEDCTIMHWTESVYFEIYDSATHDVREVRR